MASVISICNLALGNIGKPDIQDIDGPEPEAVACKKYYAHVRDIMLQGYPWWFAGKTAALAEVTNTKARWAHAYQRPSDCLKIRSLHDEALADYLSSGAGIVQGGYAYAVEGAVIYANVSPAWLAYTKALTDPTQFSPTFIEAMAWQLAVRLAMPLTRDPKVRADAYQLAVQTTATAASLDANEVRETTDAPSEMIEGRA